MPEKRDRHKAGEVSLDGSDAIRSFSVGHTRQTRDTISRGVRRGGAPPRCRRSEDEELQDPREEQSKN